MKIKPLDALEITFQSNDLRKKVTIRQYFCALLTRLFEEGEGFSGKRPFGNSGWESDLYGPLIDAGAVKGTWNEEDQEYEDYDWEEADRFIYKMIGELSKTPK